VASRFLRELKIFILPFSTRFDGRAQLGGTLAFADQLVELGAFLRAKPHYVLLDGNLFPDHDPSLPCSDRDSEVAVIFNDGSD
jgi:hypothetical protein